MLDINLRPLRLGEEKGRRKKNDKNHMGNIMACPLLWAAITNDRAKI